MPPDLLQAQLASINNRLLSIEHMLRQLTAGSRRKWWEVIGHSMADIPDDEWKRLQNFCLFIRKTGQDPPPDWDGSDPIPFPPEDNTDESR